MTAPHAHDGDTRADLETELDRIYTGRNALLLTWLCTPFHAHTHPRWERDRWVDVPCNSLGKIPITKGWNPAAVERWRNGEGREAHITQMARHIAGGGNVGLVVPPGVLVLDADTQQAVAGCAAVYPDAPMQESRPGRAHIVVGVPEDAEINATVKLELAAGITVDLRSAGRSQIVVEPSRHATGASYRWLLELPADLAELPPLAAEHLERVTAPRTSACPRTNGGKIAEGGRNAYLFGHGCGLRARNRGEAEIREELHAENARHCAPPLPAGEVDGIVASILQRYAAGPSREREEPPPPTDDHAPPDDRDHCGDQGADPERDHGSDDVDQHGRGEHELDPRRFFDGSGLVVPRLGEEIRLLGHVRLGIDGRLYRYADGVHRGDGEAFTRAHARRLLGDLFKRRHLDEALTYLRADFAGVTDRQPEGLVNLRNGLLAWEAPVLELAPHDPGVVSTVQIPHCWNPTSKCPLIKKFLMDVLPADAVEMMIEIIGYSLLAGNPLRVAILLLGPGRNGKSVLLLVIKALLGAVNVSVATLQALAENRFTAAELFGKLANICGDLDARAVKQTDIFKMLVGGDPMLAERKHRDAFTFTPFALPLFSANEAPVSSDQTEAWFDRWLVVPMEKRIPVDQVDPHLVSKLTTEAELEGLLVLAIEGLRRLMARGRFELPASVQAARGDYRERLDTVQGFVAERALIGANCWTPRAALYRAYKTWADQSGRLPVSAQNFNDHLRRGFTDRIEERTREGTRGWVGIGLLEEGR